MPVVSGVLCVSLLLGYAAASNLGDGWYRTFKPATVKLPATSADALAHGWSKSDDCDPALGYWHTQESSGPSKSKPLSLFYTAGGQPAGVRVDIWGHAYTSSIGPAAQPNLVKSGFWRCVGDCADEHWYIVVSTREAGPAMCDGTLMHGAVGDRLEVNQDAHLNFSLPLSAAAAKEQGYAPGSCMETMGQHWFLDLKLKGGRQGWVEGDLLPIVPMYTPPADSGSIHAMFFTTPVVQDGSLLAGFGDWESPFLPDVLMCENWCDDSCKWTTVGWSTMHIYFDSSYESFECPGGSGLVGRSCPDDATV